MANYRWNISQKKDSDKYHKHVCFIMKDTYCSELRKEFKERLKLSFPKKEGFKISVSYVTTTYTDVEIDEPE